MNKKTTKRALLSSVLSLVLCMAMLVGTTFAWFTDNVTSSNNNIQSGTLKIDLLLKDKDDNWTSIKDSKKAIFDYQNWEPGYTDVKVLQVVNQGTLAVKWVAKFVSAYELTALADVIDVYVKTSVTDIPSERADISNWEKVGTVRDFVNTISNTTYGKLEAGNSAYLGIALKMQESAGNEYQNMSLGGAFDIQIFATQYTSEADSFGIDYDKGAAWTGSVDSDWYNKADTEFVLSSADELAGFATLVNSGTDTFVGKTVKLGADVDLNNISWTPIGSSSNGWNSKFNGKFDGNGYTISNLYVTGSAGLGLFGYVGNAAHIEGVNIDGAYVAGNDYVGAVVGTGYLAKNCLRNCTVKKATVIAVPYLTAEGIYDGGAKAGAVAGYLLNGDISGNKAIDCSVSAYRDLGGIIGMASGEHSITVSGNTVDNVRLNYVTVIGDYDKNTKNQNMNDVVGRKDDNVTVGENTVTDVVKNEGINFVVSNDAELTALLGMIKKNSNYWNQKLMITLNENNYSGTYEFYQYPTWNGKADGNSNLKQSNGEADHTLIKFAGVGDVVFTGSFDINGWGQAGNGFTKAQAATSFTDITFRGKGEATEMVLSMTAAANNVSFNKCSFEDAKYVLTGYSGQDAVGKITFDSCNFINGNCLSNYSETLQIINCTVTNAYKGFINKSKAGTVTVDNCTINGCEYFLRTANTGVVANVTNSEITTTSDLVWFRGSNESATFKDCNIQTGYTTQGVDANSTLTIINYHVDDNGIQYYTDGLTGDVVLNNAAGFTGGELNVPTGVTVVGNKAFNKVSNLTSVTFPTSLTTLGYGAFNTCTSLESVTIPGNVTLNDRTDGNNANTFAACTSLKSLTIEEGVTSLPKSCFSGCTALTSVTIPASMETLARRAFYDCLSLKEVYLLSADCEIGDSVFGSNQTGKFSEMTIYVVNEVMKERVEATLDDNNKNSVTVEIYSANN